MKTLEQFLKSKKISVVKGRVLIKDAREVAELESKTLEQFLKSKKISVVKGRVLIKDAREVIKLEGEYEILQAQKNGLPERLAPYAETVISVSFDEMERNSQDPEKFGCAMPRSHKNYDNEDTWGCTLNGKTKDIWEWALAESGQSPDEIEAQIEIGIEEYEAEKE